MYRAPVTVVARVSVDSGAVELGRALSGLPGASVELERVIPTGPEMVPFVWIAGVAEEDVDAALAASESIEEAEHVDSLGGSMLYRCRVRRRDDGVIAGMVAAELTVLSGNRENGRWVFDVRGQGWESVRTFREFCDANGIDMTLESMSPLSASAESDRGGLTAAQSEALLAALDAGYYDTPRRATLEEVAERLDISRQALAERLRRGTRNLVAGVVRADPDPPP